MRAALSVGTAGALLLGRNVTYDADGNKVTTAEVKEARDSVVAPETPQGIQSLDMDAVTANVICSPDVSDYFKLTFNAMMSCSVTVAGGEHKATGDGPAPAAPLCETYANGGANDEKSHDFCLGMYGSMEEYKKCICVRWNPEMAAHWTSESNSWSAAEAAEEGTGMPLDMVFEAQHFSDHVPLRRCPIVIQPRCLNEVMYRSECEALMAHQEEPDKDSLMARMTIVEPRVWKEDVPEEFRNKPKFEGQQAAGLCGSATNKSDSASFDSAMNVMVGEMNDDDRKIPREII